METGYEYTYTLRTRISSMTCILKKNTRMTLKKVFEVLSDKIIALCQFNGEFFAKTQ